MNRPSATALGLLALLLGSVPAVAAYSWKSVQIWGGGYVPGIAFHPTANGPAYARTDVGGAYRLSPTNGKDWIPLNDMFTSGDDMSSLAIGLDPSDTNYVYLTGGTYTTLSWCNAASFLRSADRGSTWTKVALGSATITGTNSAKLPAKSSVCLGGNETGRGTGPRIAAKGTTIYLGTSQNGLLRSTDRGNSWTTVTTLGDTVGIASVLDDVAGNVYAAPYTGGLWKSSNGTSWTKLSGFTGTIFQMSYASSTNTIWMTTNSTSPLDQNGAGGGAVWTFNATSLAFSQVTMPAKGGKDYGYGGISVLPRNPKQVLVSTMGWWKGTDSPKSPSTFVPAEAVFLTLDGGTTWKDILANGTFDAASAYSSATSNPHWLSGLAVDPADSNHVIFGTGYGIWSTNNATAAAPVWKFSDKGIEETVPLGLASTTYGAPLVSVVGDVDGYYHANLDQPPTTRHQIEAGTNFDLSFAGKVPRKMVRIFKEATKGLGAYSNDGGKTWTAFKTYPPFVASQYSATYTSESNFAAISADGSSIVWNMQTNGVYSSKDSGASWTKSATDASLLTTADGGFRVVADRLSAGVFYIYNANTGILYRSANSGATWTAANSALEYEDSWGWGYFRAFASPKKAGELWFTQGIHTPNLWVGKGTSAGVYRSTDSGMTLTAVGGLSYGIAIGFGKGTTESVPAVYVFGANAAGTTGLFRSTDDGGTWTQIDDDAHKFGGVGMVTGDPCIFSRVYLTGAARGILYGEDGSNANSCSDRIDGLASGILPGVEPARNPALHRAGSTLASDESIQLYGLGGDLVRSEGLSTGRAILSLRGIRAGLYVARSGRHSLKVSVP